MSVKITPKPKFKRQGVDFAELSIHDCCIYDNCLLMKTNEDQAAVDLGNGDILSDMCGEYVLPVNVEITWKRK